MYKSLLATLLFSLTISFYSQAQVLQPANVSDQNSSGTVMTAERLEEIITQVSDTVQSQGNSIRFLYKERLLFCVFDENANRMRIVLPIVEREKLGEEELLNALVANYHSALDVKYALSDEVIWSVFIHPLQELTDHQVTDAIDQVFLAAATFGSSYSSTSLVFPGNTQKKEEEKPEKILNKT